MSDKRLAVIPARGGSKRIPRKNIKLFHGKPILLHVLHQIKLTQLFDEIHVSTDDEEIFKVVSDAGFKPIFLRPENISGDITPICDVLRYVVNQYNQLGFNFKTIGLFYSTAVFLANETILDAVESIEAGNKGQLISVAKFPAPLEWAMRLDSNNILEVIDPRGILKRSQDLEDAWYETADFVLYDGKNLLSDVKSTKFGYKVPHFSLDIDNLEDWELANFIYGVRQGMSE